MAGGSWLASLFSGMLSDRLGKLYLVVVERRHLVRPPFHTCLAEALFIYLPKKGHLAHSRPFISHLAGRKSAIQIGAVIWIIGCIIVSAAQNIPMLIVGRIINGFCVGICSAQVPVYITEIAPPTKRGRLVGAQQWAITWGIMIMFYISYGCSFINGNAAFRVPWALQMIPAIILFFGMIVLPESPRWLASKDRWEECEQVLILTHGKGDPHSPWVAREFQEIREWIDIERASAQVRYMDLFSAKYINRTHIGLFTQIWSQLTGMNVMMYYITYVFAMAGLTGNTLLGELHHSFLFLSSDISFFPSAHADD